MLRISNIFRSFALPAALLALALVQWGCGGDSKTAEPPTGTASWSEGGSVDWDNTSQFLKIAAPEGLAWTAEVDADWCRFSGNTQSVTGSGSRNLVLNYTRNTATSSRKAIVTVSFAESNTVPLTLTQGPYAASGANKATLSRTTVAWNEEPSQVTVTVESTLEWTLSTTDPWLWFGDSDDPQSSVSGEGNASVILHFGENGGAQRTGHVKVAFRGEEPFELALTQTANGQAPPDPVRPIDKDWMELPAMPLDEEWLYVAHTVSGVRNYSLCYDKEYGVAYWVAYPLHSYYLGSTGRTNAWGYDPSILSAYQPNLAKGMGNGYDRGHQIPSGDRTRSRALNAQTFYYSNMTAQVGRGFNQSVWANLEGRLRDDYICPDTLYVVTGCVLTTSSSPNVRWARNSNGGEVVVPAAYFKVLLRTKSGNTGEKVTSANGMTIGFWYENKAYSNSQPSRSDVKSVAQIEQLTGFTFFPDISSDVKSTVDYARWGF